MTTGQTTNADAGADHVGADEYEALRTSAVLLPHDAVWKTFSGPKAVDVLNGLVTQDVSALESGSASLAVALTPKGKVVADLLIVRAAPERFLVGASAASASAWHDLVRKYVNPRLATVTDESARLASWILAGPRAAETARRSLEGAVGNGEGEERVVAALAIELPIPVVVLIAAASSGDGLRERVAGDGATVGSAALAALLRVETGWPAVGFGMDENTIPQEANLDTLGAISFTKGCYTGQETVARVHFRGHVNRHLRGLKLQGPVPTGAALADESGKVVGDVRVVSHSPRHGAVALAMVRREVADGAVLTATPPGEAADRESVQAEVVVLPFR